MEREAQGSRKKLLYCALVIITIVTALAITGHMGFITYRRNNIGRQLLLRQMWEAGDFLNIVEVTEERLREEPLHLNYLFYNGLSHYYIANASVSTDDRNAHIDRSISRLRKLLLLPQSPHLSDVYLTLGKGYYHKGQLYYPQAIEYIERALSTGLEHEEAYQYLGAAYAHLGQYDKSIAYLQRAIQSSDSLSLKFALIDIYIISGDVGNAEQLHRTLRADTLSNRDAQRLSLLEAELLIARQEYQGAIEKINTFLAEYPNVADAYFKLGEAHWHLSEIDRARYNWRIALKIDPNHTAALRRLQR